MNCESYAFDLPDKERDIIRRYKSFDSKKHVNCVKRRLEFLKWNKPDQETLKEINKEFGDKN